MQETLLLIILSMMHQPTTLSLAKPNVLLRYAVPNPLLRRQRLLTRLVAAPKNAKLAISRQRMSRGEAQAGRQSLISRNEACGSSADATKRGLSFLVFCHVLVFLFWCN